MTFTRLGRAEQGLRRKTLLSAVSVTGQSKIIRAGKDLGDTPAAYRIQIDGAGAVGATVKLMGSTRDEIAGGILLTTFTLSGTIVDQAGTTLNVDWPFIWFDVTSIDANTTVTAEVSVDG